MSLILNSDIKSHVRCHGIWRWHQVRWHHEILLWFWIAALPSHCHVFQGLISLLSILKGLSECLGGMWSPHLRRLHLTECLVSCLPLLSIQLSVRTHPGKQRTMVQVLESLPVVDAVLTFSLAQPWLQCTFREQMNRGKLCLGLSSSFCMTSPFK